MHTLQVHWTVPRVIHVLEVELAPLVEAVKLRFSESEWHLACYWQIFCRFQMRLNQAESVSLTMHMWSCCLPFSILKFTHEAIFTVADGYRKQGSS